ncbi:hypothetical protein GlitD10_0552 [Gloeomargarita lithophora Alchichica-D10]|uniref:DUF3782 domain-containing protein n=1 Tax=Gloeomargarita lithophora Alchichica-D10 TaxID=1188229 RepID=A0A1J0AAB3_9CYAN|nr:DUF3782 domain-containing protein [Gloeomargarita lithophora]APB32866.1 hypothetical protein GlitD10_0552 [Gloeomargarita lithophora Alchichica-D10]
MSTPVTLEDIYKIFQKSQEEADRRFAEADRRAAELAAEADRRAAELAAEADRRAAELAAEADRRAAEADQQRAEREKSLAQLEKTVERTAKAVDGLTTRWGRFVEELVEPAVLRLFQERGIDIRYTYSRAKNRQPGVAMEIDILAVNDTVAVVVECKSRLSQDDVNYFLQKLTRFKASFPLYQNYHTYGAVAGIEIDEGVDSYAYRKGLFVIRPSGDTVTIANDQKFRPMAW